MYYYYYDYLSNAVYASVMWINKTEFHVKVLGIILPGRKLVAKSDHGGMRHPQRLLKTLLERTTDRHHLVGEK